MIPKIIHYCWVGNSPKPESVLYCIESWKKYCPNYEIKEWNEKNYNFEKNSYMKQAYEEKKWGFVPDYARLDIIYQYGGIYLDTDVELIKNIDELLNCKSFFGFENTGDDSFFVACGLGFGAEPRNMLVKELRDYYEGVNFRNADNSLNLLPAPQHNSSVFKKNGVIMNNNLQDIDGNIFYPAEYFCPKVFKTGKTKITRNTYSIHHFSASWMDEKIRENIKHNQAVCLRLGDTLGYLYLKGESIYQKYGLKKGIKKLCIILYENILDYKYLLGAFLKKMFNRKKTGDYILFDTSLYSKNSGDQIIMQNCELQLKGLIDIENTLHIPTHKIISNNAILKGKKKILCGTNILSCTMRKYGLWKLPKDLSEFYNIILMGVGFDSYNMVSDRYTKFLFRYMFSKEGYHSVRDSFSEECLKNLGIDNVLNTGCPTMWNLNKEHCSKIPTKKATNVVCTITDYSKDPVNDKKMLEILLKNYNNVFLWLQGTMDETYLKELGYHEKVKLISSSLKDYDSVLEQKDLDYIGTRLHAGIRALYFFHRSIIISIDNRAESIAKDTGLMIIKREKIDSLLEKNINDEFETVLTLPEDNIRKWKSQFEIPDKR